MRRSTERPAKGSSNALGNIRRRQRGVAQVGVVILVLGMFLVKTVYTQVRVSSDTDQVTALAPVFHDELRGTILSKVDRGEMTLAQAEVARQKLDVNARLVQDLALRIQERQYEVAHIARCSSCVEVVTQFLGAGLGYEIGKMVGYVVGAASGIVGFIAPTGVRVEDIRPQIRQLQDAWLELEPEGLQQAIVAAKIRNFKDRIDRYASTFTPEQLERVRGRIMNQLMKGGWKIPGVDFKNHESVAKFVDAEIERYKEEAAGAPVLSLKNVQVIPRQVKRKQWLKMTAVVELRGVKDPSVKPSFLVDGTPIVTRTVASGNVDVSDERFDVPFTIVADYQVPAEMEETSHDVSLKVEVRLPAELQQRWKRDAISQEISAGTFTVSGSIRGTSDYESFLARERDITRHCIEVCCKARRGTKKACSAKADTPCSGSNDSPCCRIEPVPGEPEKTRCVECRCNLIAPAGIGIWQTALEGDEWFKVHASFGECMDAVVDDYLNAGRRCCMSWARTQGTEANRGAYTDCSGKVQSAAQKETDKCKQHACDAKCAEKEMEGYIAESGLWSTGCECR